MPESKSRSRKRRAAAAAAKAGGSGPDEDRHSQTCAAERYIPRFGSTKRSRTTSQPARALRSVNNEQSTTEHEDQLKEGHNTLDDATLTDDLEVEGLHSGRGVDIPPSTAQVQSSEEGTQSHPMADDCGALKAEKMATNIGNGERDVAAVSEEMQDDSTPQPIPGMSLSQNLHNLHSDSDITTCDGESVPLPPDTAPVAILAPHSQHSANSPTMVGISSREEMTAELNPTLSEDGMNLDLLDPLECIEEEEVPCDEGLEEIAQVNKPQPEKVLATNEDTPLITVNTSLVTSVGDVTSTQSIDRLDTAVSLCPSLTHDTSDSCASSPQAITSIPPHQQLDTVTTSPDISIEKLTGEEMQEYLYPEPSCKMNARDGSTTECGGSSECMETGVEDVVAVGGNTGQLQLTSNSQYSDHIKGDTHPTLHQSVTPVTDELLAVREMMDLTAHDLLESQLLDEATVPSCSPITTSQRVERGGEVPPQPRDPHNSHGGDDMMAVAQHTGAGVADSSHTLQGLIKELSALNQFVLACKRELEAGRRQREAWIRTQQCHRGR